MSRQEMCGAGPEGSPSGPAAAPGAGDIPVLASEIQLLLAEKRTSLSVLQTGLSLCALPLTVFSVLIATSKYYEPAKVLHLFVPVMLINAALLSLAAYLVARSLRKLHQLELMIDELKRKSPEISKLIT